MRTLTLERNGRIYLTNVAHIMPQEKVADEVASGAWDVDGAGYIKWISGAFVRSDEPNSNKQYWTAGDLEMAEYTIRGAPLNLVHRVKQPVGFFRDTERVSLTSDGDQASQSFRIDALAGMWTHLFPFEAALVDAADEQNALFYSMECQGTHIVCSGDEGCGKTFNYMKPSTHCEHLKDRASIRHIVNPTFRGGALIIPPVRPGWAEANATVYEPLILQEAAGYAEEMGDLYEAANAQGADLTPQAWEHMMAAIVSLTA